MKIAIVGAPASGKTQLAQGLTMHLPALRVYDAPPVQTLQSGGFMHVLLMGLDLPGMTAAQQDTDKALRDYLAKNNLAGYDAEVGAATRRRQLFVPRSRAA